MSKGVLGMNDRDDVPLLEGWVTAAQAAKMLGGLSRNAVRYMIFDSRLFTTVRKIDLDEEGNKVLYLLRRDEVEQVAVRRLAEQVAAEEKQWAAMRDKAYRDLIRAWARATGRGDFPRGISNEVVAAFEASYTPEEVEGQIDAMLDDMAGEPAPRQLPEEHPAIRDWAKQQGIPLRDNQSIPPEVVTAFQALYPNG